MTRRHDDIETLRSEIHHMKVNMNDGTLGPVFWEQALKDFMQRHAGTLEDLLHELEVLRDRQDARK